MALSAEIEGVVFWRDSSFLYVAESPAKLTGYR